MVICSKETVANAKQGIEDAVKPTQNVRGTWDLKDDIKKNLQLVSLGPVQDGITDISANIHLVNGNGANPVQLMYIDDEKGHRDPCVLIWNKEYLQELTTANLFFAIKEQWKKHRNYDVYTTWNFQYHGCSFLPKSVVKEQVFLPFAALEYGRPCCLEGDPMDNIEPVKKSFFNILESNAPLQDETIIALCASLVLNG